MSLARVAIANGHQLVGVVGRGDVTQAAAILDVEVLSWDDRLPAADLLVLGVRDDVIAVVADKLRSVVSSVSAGVHLSGSLSIKVLEPLQEAGLSIGGFHPLQSLPDHEVGANRLPGSWVGVTGDSSETADMLFGFAESLGTIPFDLPDDARPLYHAGASVAANYLVANLALAKRLFEGAGVPWQAAQPLVEAVAGNLFELGPEAALTGPIARGDVETVREQLAAIRHATPEVEQDFVAIGKAVARLAGREEEFEELWS